MCRKNDKCWAEDSVFSLWPGRSWHRNFILGRCPSAVRPVFPVLVFQLSKQQTRIRTTSSSILATPPNCIRTKRFFLNLLIGFPSGNPPKIGTFTAWSRARNRARTPPESCLSSPNFDAFLRRCLFRSAVKVVVKGERSS